MDVHPQAKGDEAGQNQPKSVDELRNHSLHHVTKEPEVEHKDVPLSTRPDQNSSNESITDVDCTNEDTLLLPNHKPMISQAIDKNEPHLENPVVSNQPIAHPLQEGVANGTPTICTPPAAANALVKPGSVSAKKCSGHSHHPHKKRLPSTTKSQHSFKTNAAQLQEVAGNDCCVHCVLACLFCELTSLCSVLAQCLSCGAGCEVLCCCSEAATGGLACGEDACSALLDCGILEDCCQSSDCLEICLECCAICFPA